MTSGSIKAAALTDVGRKRRNNEDSILSLPQQGVFCVADGMGGGREGQVASKAITDALQQGIQEEAAAWDSQDLRTRTKRIHADVTRVNMWIRKRADDNGFGQMGSTFVAAVFDPKAPSQGIVLHAGDSRLYRYRDRSLTQLTTDHTFVAEMGVRSEKELPAEFRGVVTKAVGLRTDLVSEETPFDLRPDDKFILCSDGLTRMLTDKILLKILRQNENEGPESLVRILVDQANEAGGEDNVSVVVACPDFGLAPAVVPLAPPLPSQGDPGDGPATPVTITGGAVVKPLAAAPAQVAPKTPPMPEETPEKDTAEGVTPESGNRDGRGDGIETPQDESSTTRRTDKRSAVPRSRGKIVGSIAVVVLVGILFMWMAAARKERSASLNVTPGTGTVALGSATDRPATVAPKVPASLIVTSYTVAVTTQSAVTTAVLASIATAQVATSSHEVALPQPSAQSDHPAMGTTAVVAATGTLQPLPTTVVPAAVAIAVHSQPPAAITSAPPASVARELVRVQNPVVLPPVATQAVQVTKVEESHAPESPMESARKKLSDRRDSALRTGRWGALRKEFEPWMDKLDAIEPDGSRRALVMGWLAIWDEAAHNDHLEATVKTWTTALQTLAELVDAQLPGWAAVDPARADKADAFCKSLGENQALLLKGIVAFGKRETGATAAFVEPPDRIVSLCEFVKGLSSVTNSAEVRGVWVDLGARCAKLEAWANGRMTNGLPIRLEDYPLKELKIVVAESDLAWTQLYLLIEPLDQQVAFSRARADDAMNKRLDRIAVRHKEIVLDRELHDSDRARWQRTEVTRIGDLLSEIDQLVRGEAGGGTASAR